MLTKIPSIIRHFDRWDVDAGMELVQQPRTADQPDEYWIHAGEEHECYTAGRRTTNMPAEVLGIPVHQMLHNGQLTYHGPGQLGFVMILDGMRAYMSHEVRGTGGVHKFARDCILSAVAEYLEQEHAFKINYHPDDPGLYDDTGAKTASFVIDVINRHYVIYCSINFFVDLRKYSVIDVCGVQNRNMANVFKDRRVPSTELWCYGDAIVHRISEKLYG